MKRLFEKLSMCLIMLIVAVTVSSCDHMKKSKSEIRHDDSLMVSNEIRRDDSLMVSKMMQDIDNPTFTDCFDVISFQRSEGKWRHQDSVFFSIPEKAMRNVVSVLEKSGKPLTKMSISNEFEMNKHVYLNLPDKQDQVVDTIINGKHVQLVQSSSTNITTKED